MATRIPFGLQFEIVEPSAQVRDFLYDPHVGISWITTSTGRQPFVEWEWLTVVSTTTRNRDQDVESPPTSTATKTVEPNH